MHFDVNLSSPFDRWNGIRPLTEAATLAEELGFYGVQFGDHVVMTYGEPVPLSGSVWYDDFVLAAHLAAKTTTLRLIFNALIIPYRPPMQTAKLISTLDVVSEGRLIMGVASGYLEGEFKALGVPFAERGAITDEYIRAMKVLWAEELPKFEGKYVRFGNLAFLPKPIQKPHPPLWIGGGSPRAQRRAVELGDGWTPNKGTPDELKERISAIKERVRGAGRDPSTMTFAYSMGIGKPPKPKGLGVASGPYFSGTPLITPEQIIERIQQYKKAGITHLSIRFDWDTPEDFKKNMRFFSKEVMPRFAK